MTDPAVEDMVDCIVIGGGPAGLTAAIYLARYHLSVTVFDDMTSRAATIPVSHNHAGFPDGISGEYLLGRMRTQAVLYGTKIRTHGVISLTSTTITAAVSFLRASTVARCAEEVFCWRQGLSAAALKCQHSSTTMPWREA